MPHEIETRNDELDNFEKSERKSLAMEPRAHITSVSAFGNVESPEIGATSRQTDARGGPADRPIPACAGQKARPDDGVLADSGPAGARLYTFRAFVWGVMEDATYLRDPAGLVYLSVPWDGERIGDERTVTVEVRR